ncbi:unnamed protein product [Lactuca virosa]|uniref:Uncharacterized protein n=1 Tax=Lactuca virosa TaxID=75947 RepID=A0AAU9M8J8_9ASTR|nr:unnamed protein product [Lactuca virosa]
MKSLTISVKSEAVVRGLPSYASWMDLTGQLPLHLTNMKPFDQPYHLVLMRDGCFLEDSYQKHSYTKLLSKAIHENCITKISISSSVNNKRIWK